MEIKLDVPWRDIKGIIRSLGSFKKHMGVAAWSLSSIAVKQLKATTPRSREGATHIADFWGKEARKNIQGWIDTIIIRNTNPRAKELLPFLEFGTRPHMIYGNPILHFTTEGGEDVFTTVVHHPGTKPHHMVKYARMTLEAKLKALEAEVIRRVARSVEQGSLV